MAKAMTTSFCSCAPPFYFYIQKSVTLPLKLQSPCAPHLNGSFFGPPTSPVLGFVSPSNSGFAPRKRSGCNSSPDSVTSICGLAVDKEEGEESPDWGDWLIFGADRGVLKAPVDCFWRFSKISCSSFGRRGGEGPFPNWLLASSLLTCRVVENVRVGRKGWERLRRRMVGRRGRRVKEYAMVGVAGGDIT